MEKLEHFAGLLADLEIAAQILPILIDNGFDDWEQTVEILEHPELLNQIGITDEQTKKQVMAAISVADDYESPEEKKQKQKLENPKGEQSEQQKNSSDIQQQQQQSQKSQEMSKEEIQQYKHAQKYQKIVDQTKAKSLTLKDLKLGTNLKRSSNASLNATQMGYQSEANEARRKEKEQQAYLQELQVLTLNDKKLTSFDILEKCTNLKGLHLFSNCIFSIQSPILNLHNLTTLRLENNYIARIENLTNCSFLEKLYLNNNHISCLSGLESQTRLQELQISNQQSGIDFTFDPQSCAALGNNLQLLEIENSQIVNLPPCFAYLSSIGILKLRNNKLNSSEEFLEPLKEMHYLQELHLKGNPMAKQQKYRDKLVLMSRSLNDLDGKRILPKEREFLIQLWKKKNGMLEQKENKDNKKQGAPKLQDVNGQQIKYVLVEDEAYSNPKNYQKINSGGDFKHGFSGIQSTKHVPNSNYYG